MLCLRYSLFTDLCGKWRNHHVPKFSNFQIKFGGSYIQCLYQRVRSVNLLRRVEVPFASHRNALPSLLSHHSFLEMWKLKEPSCS